MPTELEYLRDQFSLELENGKGFSQNTVKAYISDVTDLFDFMESKKQSETQDIDLELLRDWLWRVSEKGLAKTTLARKVPQLEHSLHGYSKMENLMLTRD